jgi:phospholipase/lecithinase/hemolysin/sugar lactone lactonase YvrE
MRPRGRLVSLHDFYDAEGKETAMTLFSSRRRRNALHNRISPRTFRFEPLEDRTLLSTLATGPLTQPSAPSAAGEIGDVELVVMFDESQNENPEGIAVDKAGNVFVSVALLGEIRRIAPGSNEAVPFGKIDGFEGSGGTLLGLVADAPGNTYAAACFSCSSSDNTGELAGVWRFDRNTGEAERLPGTEPIQGADGLTFDNRGNLYVSDVKTGEIWIIPPGGTAELWVQDDALAPPTPADFGINGIAYRQGAIYGVSTSRQSVVAIPIETDGSAGPVDVLGTLPGFFFPDGVAFDVHGGFYIATQGQDAIVRVDPHDVEGSFEVVAGGGAYGLPQEDDPMDTPASLAFGTGMGDRQTLFFTNYSISELFGGGPKHLTSVASVEVGVPGQPLPPGPVPQGPPPPFSEIIVFGDSLYDNGNVFIATSADPAFPTLPPSPPYFEGQWSNGPVNIEVLALELGLPVPEPSLAGGTNYAWSGAETGYGLGVFPVPGLGTQIDTFLGEGNTLDGSDLVAAGGTDPALPVANLVQHITTLVAAGGEHFLTANYAPFGAAPQFAGTPAVGPLNALSDAFNALLSTEMDDLEAELGVSIDVLDVADLFVQVQAAPALFGLVNVADPACSGDPVSLTGCGPSGTIVPNPDDYFFWDPIGHPTRVVHRLYGEQAASLFANPAGRFPHHGAASADPASGATLQFIGVPGLPLDWRDLDASGKATSGIDRAHPGTTLQGSGQRLADVSLGQPQPNTHPLSQPNQPVSIDSDLIDVAFSDPATLDDPLLGELATALAG